MSVRWRILSGLMAGVLWGTTAMAFRTIPEKTVVLTFDDNVRSHLTFVAPLLKEKGFRATFFVTHKWMHDSGNFLNWNEIRKIYDMGFEIGNHSWTHAGFHTPQSAAHLEAELSLVDRELKRVGIPRPVSFAWTGNAFGPEAVRVLKNHGILFARRGMQPEKPYGTLELGPLFDPSLQDPLLIPSAGDAYPNLTLDHFISVVERAKKGRAAVLQFHGVPDPVHPWVSTDPNLFRDCMEYLEEHGYRVIAMEDLKSFLHSGTSAMDPMTKTRFPSVADTDLPFPQEQLATRADLPFWAENMFLWHGYSVEEVAQVTGWSLPRLETELDRIRFDREPRTSGHGEAIRLLPYPGGRHPRTGFLEGAISPMRGTKISLFPPWEEGGYVVLDLPEAIFSNLGLTFLAHTHIPTIWDDQGTWIENVDWIRRLDGTLEFERRLPNGIVFGARAIPDATGVECELWLTNGTSQPLSGLRTQVCAMLKMASGFSETSNRNKRMMPPVAAVRSATGNRWILKAFGPCRRVWGNERCPCMHSDPEFPDAAPGQTVRVHGRVWFYEGEDIAREIHRAQTGFECLAE